ncbi:polysaccharide deacetylase family protein [Sporosarcina sp. JAI121]|uniref:polysaccharide deacetylase family protein n=1 Tax=Sporosarcina sp. JAI121 TaxID=2723064 RepID=UPI0015CC286C|nr:polysaccharide deacetylase family protein [Sporosarcina sp. JAI121]NYF23531.1 peptidoglycan/xylan/chitin deacetylase (PgdA/CDA1 family) [Sporosarcina sp. JAI121]
MKRSVLAICTTLMLSVVFGTTMSNASAKKPTHYIGLHDRLLDFKDVRVIDNDMKVPLGDIAKVLYIPLEKEEGATYIRKRDIELIYDETTKLTTKNGTQVGWSPIVDVGGTLFISVKYIARELGFKVEYFQKLRTLRIYRDDYEHMNAEAYKTHVKKLLDKKQEAEKTAKPPVKKPAKPVKPAAKSKANVYLTFDDGPNKFTAINNATLKKYDAQGTFFFLGKHMKNNESIVKAVAKEGHYIGTHSMTHDAKKVYKSTKAFIDEMNEGTQLIHEMTGHDAKLLRVPYGSKPHVTPAMKKQLNQIGYKMWDWDVDSNDWKYTDKETDQIIKNVRTGVEKADKSGDRDIIILLHDRSQTSKALPQIIEWLQKEGYTIKTYEPEHHIIQNFLHDTTL